MSPKIYPAFDHYSDFPSWCLAKGDEAKSEAAAEIDGRGADEFLAATPTYFPSEFNAAMFSAWLESRGHLPWSLWNLTITMRDLLEDGLLERAPVPVAPQPDPSRGVIRIENAFAEYVPGAAESEALAKLQDDASLSSGARKGRDKKLAILAGRQRRSLAAPRGREDLDAQIRV